MSYSVYTQTWVIILVNSDKSYNSINFNFNIIVWGFYLKLFGKLITHNRVKKILAGGKNYLVSELGGFRAQKKQLFPSQWLNRDEEKKNKT